MFLNAKVQTEIVGKSGVGGRQGQDEVVRRQMSLVIVHTSMHYYS